mmetsp:Transcript_32019/g.80615  ORF Transcript_32019/g.80615 Transcript_32019/m.80615 type:complete len:266 (-) Transcript_32019:715-1512(-)
MGRRQDPAPRRPQHRLQGPLRAQARRRGVPGPDQPVRAAAAHRLRGPAQRVGRGLLHGARLSQRGRQPAQAQAPVGGAGPLVRGRLHPRGLRGPVHTAPPRHRVGRRDQAVRLPPRRDQRVHCRRAGVLPHAAASGRLLPLGPPPRQHHPPRRPVQGQDRPHRLWPRRLAAAGGHGQHRERGDPPRQQGLHVARRRLHQPQHPPGRLRPLQGHPPHGQGPLPLRQGRRRQEVRGGAPQVVRHGRVDGRGGGGLPGHDAGRADGAQ